MMRNTVLLCLGFIFMGGLSAGAVAPPVDPSLQVSLNSLNLAHPRLILTDERLAALKKLAATDPVYQAAVDAFLVRAKLYLNKPPVTASPEWNNWRETVARVYAVSFAWRWTGDEAYAKKAVETLTTACDFPDWHAATTFLDTAEMTHAVALGYDWMYAYMDQPTRDKIRTAIFDKGLKVGLPLYDGNSQPGWWTRSDHNWNLVCNAGLLTGALAVAETDPDGVARKIVEGAVGSMRIALQSYSPDGAWMEGPSYWEYATRYGVLGIASLQTALGKDFGLVNFTGLSNTWKYAVYVTSPDGLTQFNYSDSIEHHWSLPFLYWIATQYHIPAAAEVEASYFGKPHPWWPTAEKEVLDPRFAIARVLDLVWYVPEPVPAPATKAPMPLDARFKGKVEIASFRSAWHDPKALCLFVKAGPNGGLVNHGHDDDGSFELYANGIRWALDMGSDPYGPGYFDTGVKGAPGKRWTFLKTSSRGHNVLMLDDQNQDPFSSAPIEEFQSSPDLSFVTINLSSLYPTGARVERGFLEIGHREVLVQDELNLNEPHDVIWGVITEATVRANGASAVFTRWGQTLAASILSPAGAEFTVEPVENQPKYSRLVVRLKAQKGPVTLAILLAPNWPGGPQPILPVIKPLSEWKLPILPTNEHLPPNPPPANLPQTGQVGVGPGGKGVLNPITLNGE